MVWRLTDSLWYQLIFLLVLFTELSLLGLLASAFAIYTFDSAIVLLVHDMLITAAIGTLIGLVCLTIFGFIIQITSRRYQRYNQQQVEIWLNLWIDIVLYDIPPPLPASPLAPVAIEALMRLRDDVGGTELNKLHELFQHYQLHVPYLKRLQKGRPLQRLEALELLARLGLPDTLPAIQAQIDHPKLLVKAAAAKTAAYIISSSIVSDAHISSFIEAITATSLPRGALEETLALTGTRAEEILRQMMHRPDIQDTHLIAIINVAGWLHLERMAPYIALFLDHVEPTVRATCLKVLAQMNRLPGDSQYAIQKSVTDTNEVVRLQAVRALSLLPLHRSYPLFWQALKDDSWWVRLAAAETLWSKGEEGCKMLYRFTDAHTSPQSSEIARYVLLNTGDINTDVWIWSRE